LQPESSATEQITTWLKQKKDIPTKGIYLIPTSPDAPEYQNGMNAYHKKNFKTASENLENYLTKNTNDVETRFKLGVCYLKLGQLKKSRDEFLNLLLINDHFHKAYYNLGVLYSAKSDFKNINKAHFFFEKFLLLDPDSPQAREIQQWLKSN
jgi:tetratricopeptide (TPR) repeat protein